MQKQTQPNKHICTLHQKYQVQMVCIHRQCESLRLLCPQCISQETHAGHKLITLKKYYQITQRLSQINPKYKEAIQMVQTQQLQKITGIRKKMKTMLEQIQQAIAVQFLSYDGYQKNIGEVQQASGEISIAANDPLFIQAFNGNQTKELNQYVKQTSLSLIGKIDQFQYEITTKTHEFMGLIRKIHKNGIELSLSKIKLGPSKNRQLSKQDSFECPQGNVIKIQQKQQDKFNKMNQKFFFSNYFKPSFFELSEDRLTITRKNKQQFGLTMYGLVNKPFTKQVNQIVFKLAKQGNRFVYVGVCDIQKMKDNKYRGCYQLGGGMHAIRQGQPGKSGVSLHSTQKAFSDQHIVGFDFVPGDTITLQLDYDKNELNFIKNRHKQKFKMPINAKQQWYPFVGLKYQGDSFQIVK